ASRASRLGDRSGLWPGDVFPAPIVALLSAILRPDESEAEEVLLVFGWRVWGVVVVLPNRLGLRAGPGSAGRVSATTFHPGKTLVVRCSGTPHLVGEGPVCGCGGSGGRAHIAGPLPGRGGPASGFARGIWRGGKGDAGLLHL